LQKKTGTKTDLVRGSSARRIYQACPTVEKHQLGFGDLWTWTAICADTKLVPTWFVGRRDVEHGHAFISDLASRLANRVQLTSDGHKAYLDVIDDVMQTTLIMRS
jgi:hypothetical protein